MNHTQNCVNMTEIEVFGQKHGEIYHLATLLWVGLTCLQCDQTLLTDRNGAGFRQHLCQRLHDAFHHLHKDKKATK